MDNIRVDVGVCTPITIDLSEYDFTGIEKVILTIKNLPDVSAPVLIEREYYEPKLYRDIITAEESLLLKNTAVYDFTKLVNGVRYKEGPNGFITLRKSVGGCLDE